MVLSNKERGFLFRGGLGNNGRGLVMVGGAFYLGAGLSNNGRDLVIRDGA